jgi:hypothetical protein
LHIGCRNAGFEISGDFLAFRMVKERLKPQGAGKDQSQLTSLAARSSPNARSMITLEGGTVSAAHSRNTVPSKGVIMFGKWS